MKAQTKHQPLLKLEHAEGDITHCEVDVIVNAANNKLLPGAGVSGAIHDAAGPYLEAECRQIGYCDFGEIKVTHPYGLPCSYLFHTVAPIFGHHDGKEEELLFYCFYQSLLVADALGVYSIAFPAIGAGTHGNPLEDVVRVAEWAVHHYSNDHPNTSLKRVFMVHYGDKLYCQP